MDNTPSHLNLPKRIHWNELQGNLMRALNEVNDTPCYSSNYCITYPPQKQIYVEGFDFCSVLNLNAICNCGKAYKEHKVWKKEIEKQSKLGVHYD